jgi:hypothetical protein
MRETSTREGGNYPPIYKNPAGIFYMPQSWDMGHIILPPLRRKAFFRMPRKIRRLRPGLNPRTRVPVASMLTTRPPKPSCLTLNIMVSSSHLKIWLICRVITKHKGRKFYVALLCDIFNILAVNTFVKKDTILKFYVFFCTKPIHVHLQHNSIISIPPTCFGN